MGRKIDILRKVTGQFSFITITSDEFVTVEGCQRIVECSDVIVILKTVKFTVEIYGMDMKARSFNNDCVEVSGKIQSVQLVPERLGDRS